MLSLLILLSGIIFPVSANSGSIEEFLSGLPGSNIKVLKKEAFYSSIYEVMFEQLIDHNDPEKGTFLQRLYISHTDPLAPVVLSTEGYSASYYYTTELASMLQCNQIIAEHRYFGESVPDSVDWNFLTTWQAATDHHVIIEKFKQFYRGNWITTGISKGGQTVMFHGYYYPDDVDAHVPYVAPLNNAVEDLRVYTFLDHVGSRRCRNRIRKFQINALKREQELIPEFKKFSDKKGYTYELVGGAETAFEYCVLEYSFAYWQWGYSPCSEIPGKKVAPKEIIYHMNKVAGFDYFADKFVLEYQPFFYQAYTEMGYYGYELDRFKPYLKHAKQRGFDFALPELDSIGFNGKLLQDVANFIDNEAENYIFIYGERDTWSSTAVQLSGKTNSKVFYKPKGTHRTRIRNMPEEEQDEIMTLLASFLGE